VLHAIGVMFAINALVKAIDQMEAVPKPVTPRNTPTRPSGPTKIRRYCDYCKSEFDAEPTEAACPYCGAPVSSRSKPIPTRFTYYGQPESLVPEKKASNGMAIAALVFSLVGLAISWVPFVGMILPIVGIVLGGVAIGKGRQEGYGGKGLATTGIVLSSIALGIGMLMTVIVFL
jgi:hypothetical protein